MKRFLCVIVLSGSQADIPPPPASLPGSAFVLYALELADAPFEEMPRDEALVRGLRNQLPQGSGLLLVRRAWNDAGRCFSSLGLAPLAIARLASGQESNRRFALFGTLPSSFADFDAVLFCESALQSTPGVFQDMLSHLSEDAALCPRILLGDALPETPLSRLERFGFSLSPLDDAPDFLSLSDAPSRAACFPVSLLRAAAAHPNLPVPCRPLPDCAFVRADNRPLHAYLDAVARRAEHAPFGVKAPADRAAALFLRRERLRAVLPIVQMVCMLLAARLGLPELFLLAVLLPELSGRLSLARLPAALVRLSLLPMLAGISANALLRLGFAKSRLLRPYLSPFWESPACAPLWGLLLLFLGILGVHAASLAVAAALLWLAAPLIARSMDTPVVEYVPVVETT